LAFTPHVKALGLISEIQPMRSTDFDNLKQLNGLDSSFKAALSSIRLYFWDVESSSNYAKKLNFVGIGATTLKGFWLFTAAKEGTVTIVLLMWVEGDSYFLFPEISKIFELSLHELVGTRHRARGGESGMHCFHSDRDALPHLPTPRHYR
jgi:hypothetical protein